ncbi:unnamed protein product, partial [Amoebophrya sp. A25]
LQCSDAGDQKKNPSLMRDYSGLLCKSELWTLVHLLDAINTEVQVHPNAEVAAEVTNTATAARPGKEVEVGEEDWNEKQGTGMIDDIWVAFRLISSPRKFLLPEDEKKTALLLRP